MPCEINLIDGDIIRVLISGTMSPADQQRIQDQGKKLMAQGVNPKLLVILEGFQGWTKGDAWDDVGFMLTQGNNILKMAFVGDEQWKDQAYAFVGKGLRSTEIEFFHSAVDAEAWLRA